MKPIVILYATQEGHTARVARRIAEVLRRRGLHVHAANLAGPETIRLANYSAAILAASVHGGVHEYEMAAFVKTHLTELAAMPTAFVSVTLSEAGAERPDATIAERTRSAAQVQDALDRFFHQTGWRPARVKPVAGALLYTKYNFFLRLIMRQIAKKSGSSTDTSHDHDYTNWPDLDRFAQELATEFSATAAAPLQPATSP